MLRNAFELRSISIENNLIYLIFCESDSRATRQKTGSRTEVQESAPSALTSRVLVNHLFGIRPSRYPKLAGTKMVPKTRYQKMSDGEPGSLLESQNQISLPQWLFTYRTAFYVVLVVYIITGMASYSYEDAIDWRNAQSALENAAELPRGMFTSHSCHIIFINRTLQYCLIRRSCSTPMIRTRPT